MSAERLPVRLFNGLHGVLDALGRKPRGFRESRELFHEQAAKVVGVDDFGDPAYRAALDVLCEAYDREARLTPFGRMMVVAQFGTLLRNRLVTEKALRIDPRIEATPIRRPVFVLGLPRTGTTALHHLLGQDPNTQVLEYWIAASPGPRPPRAEWERDPRFKQSTRELATTYWLDPSLKAIHLMTADGPEECRHLLSQTFTDDTFDCNATLPSYTKWYASCDMRPTYRQHKRVLQLIGSTSPEKRWVLKYPVHMRNLRTVLETYPDACFVQCHRDPSEVLPSLCSLITGWRAIYEGDVDRAAIARSQTELWAAGMEHGLEVRREQVAQHSSERFFDLDFREVLSDPVAAVKRIYHHFDLPLTDEAERRFTTWRAANPRGKHGEHHYTIEEFGMTASAVRDRFAEYLEHFGMQPGTGASTGTGAIFSEGKTWGLSPSSRPRTRTRRETALLAKATELLPAAVRGVTQRLEDQLVAASGSGSRIRDVSGNAYIDYLLGSGALFLGHAHPGVVAAANESVAKGAGYLIVNENALALAEEIVRVVPCAEKVAFHSSGSEAVACALRLARATTGREKILKFEGGFHGMSDYALQSNQWLPELVELPAARAVSAGIPRAVSDQVLVAPFNDLKATLEIFDRYKSEIAAIVIEPLERTWPPAPGFLEGLRAATRAAGVLLVFDEIVTGFRLALGGAQERYGVTPDLCAIGKSISSGFPFAAVAGRGDIMSRLDPRRRADGDYVAYTGTYSGNAVSTAAALAALRELSKPGVYARLDVVGTRLRSGLEASLARAGLPAQVVGEPSAFEVWFCKTPVTDFRSSLSDDRAMHARFAELLFERGIMKAHEKFFVSIVHTDDDVAATLAAFESASEALALEFAVAGRR